MISIIIAAHNAELYIAEAIESILNQTYSAFELIIVEDSSTDNTWSIIQTYAEQDQRIQIYQTDVKNGGLAKNVGASHSQYKYIAFLDSDDIAFPDRIEKQFNYMKNHPTVVVTGTYLQRITPEGLMMAPITNGPTSIEEFHQLDRTQHLISLYGTSAMVRKDVFDKVDGHAPGVVIADDAELWDRMAQYGECVVIPEILIYYRQHANSISVVNIKKRHLWHAFIRARHDMRLQGQSLTMEDYQLEYNKMSRFELFGIQMHANSRRHIRLAKIHQARRHYRQMGLSYVKAILYRPAWTITRLIYGLSV